MVSTPSAALGSPFAAAAGEVEAEGALVPCGSGGVQVTLEALDLLWGDCLAGEDSLEGSGLAFWLS
jgi:hypothetical protein